jgi:ATP synthase protein I
MTNPDPVEPDQDPLVTETRLRRDRRERWLREGDMSVGRRLAQIGVLGWIFVVPTLAGLFLGRWLDTQMRVGHFLERAPDAAGAVYRRLDRLEMDERAMIDLAALPLPVTLTLCFSGGLLLGFAYFRAMRITADLIVGGGSALLGLALTVGRLFVLGAGFYLAVLAGGPALLAALAGFLCAKALMLRRTRESGA